MKNYLSIREFSRLSGIEASTLRYWDEIKLFSPVKRHPDNNYRYYTPDQIIAVNFITVLSSLDISLKTISEMENKRNPENIMELIDKQEITLDRQMHCLREAYSVIHTRRELIKQGLRADINEISVVNMPKRSMKLGQKNNYKKGENFYESFTGFCKDANNNQINLNYPIGGYHENIENFYAYPGNPDCFYSLDPEGNKTIEAGDYLVAYHNGYYGDFADFPEKIKKYAKKNNLDLYGPVYVIYLFDEICLEDRTSYLAQFCIPVKSK